jgi:uncharacterized protein YPO0396
MHRSKGEFRFVKRTDIMDELKKLGFAVCDSRSKQRQAANNAAQLEHLSDPR